MRKPRYHYLVQGTGRLAVPFELYRVGKAARHKIASGGYRDMLNRALQWSKSDGAEIFEITSPTKGRVKLSHKRIRELEGRWSKDNPTRKAAKKTTKRSRLSKLTRI